MITTRSDKSISTFSSFINFLVNVKKCKCQFNVKHRECLRDHPSQRLMIQCLTIIQIELEFGNVGFWGEGKTEVPREKPLGARKRTNKLNPHMTPGPGIEPRTHWWEASALTTAPSLLPLNDNASFTLPKPKIDWTWHTKHICCVNTSMILFDSNVWPCLRGSVTVRHVCAFDLYNSLHLYISLCEIIERCWGFQNMNQEGCQLLRRN